MRTLIKNVRLILSDRIITDGCLVIQDGMIDDFGRLSVSNGHFDSVVDGAGMFLSPGFIDIHVHGGGGYRLYDNIEEGVLRILRTHISGGTTTIFPTLSGLRHDDMVRNLSFISNLCPSLEARTDVPHIGGLHLEGPYIGGALSAGDNSCIRDPDLKEAQQYLEIAPNIRRWSAAPERAGGMEFGRWCENNGIKASIGHSDATLAQVYEAYDNGYRAVTHLYSVTSGYHRNGAYREAGVIEAAWLIDELDAEMICDGKHMPEDFIRLVYKIKGPEHVALVTDSTRWTGVDVPAGKPLPQDGRGRMCYVEDGVAFVESGKCFAGSIATYDRLVRTAVMTAGIDIVDAVRMASLTPARMSGIDGVTGSISRGKRADLLIFDDNIRISTIFKDGRIVEPLALPVEIPSFLNVN